MPRTPRPWYRAGEDGWYVKIRGRLHRLASGRESEPAAWAAFQALLLRDGLAESRRDLRVDEVAAVYLEHCHAAKAPATYRSVRARLAVVVAKWGGFRVSELRAGALERWLASGGWAADTRRAYLLALRAALKHCRREGLLPTPRPEDDPVGLVKLPPPGRRDRTLSGPERAELLAACPPSLRELVELMLATGCRPDAARLLEARHVRWHEGVAVLPSKGRPYELVLPGWLLERLRAWSVARPAGPLLRNSRGEPWTANALRCAFRQVRRKAPGLAGVVATTLRHTFATDALERGESPAVVAGLLNHRGLDMISRHYSHITERRAALRRAVEGASPPAPESPPPHTQDSPPPATGHPSGAGRKARRSGPGSGRGRPPGSGPAPRPRSGATRRSGGA
jgi:integrase